MSDDGRTKRLGVQAQCDLHHALGKSKSTLITVGWLSAIINILLLAGPLYMLLVYDSVMPSGSVETLLGLLAMLVFVYLFHGLFDVLRSRLLCNVASAFDARLSGPVYSAIMWSAKKAPDRQGDGLTPLRDLSAIRGFLSSAAPGAMMDLPWIVLFLGLLTALHFWLGFTTLIGALILLGLTFLNDRMTQRPNEEVALERARSMKLAQNNRRHHEVISALGMNKRLQTHWQVANAQLNEAQYRVTRPSSLTSSVSKVFRLLLQSLVLTVGALLYLAADASGGIVFAASILAARALAPIDQTIAHWSSFTAARQGWERLHALLTLAPSQTHMMTQLPAPCERLSVENLTIVPAGMDVPAVAGIQFQLEAGDALGIIGPSAAGKTTLTRALVGLVQPAKGAVRLDGATLDQWDQDELGCHCGYLPQSVELLDGTIAQNIARFDPDQPSDAVIAAAKVAGVHDMILSFVDGYDTVIGSGAVQLSAGQRQRLGLARAFYGDPFLIVLDEPNSNLDTDGEKALQNAVAAARARGAIVTIVAHRPSTLRQANKVLVLKNGCVAALGDRDEILAKTVVPAGQSSQSTREPTFSSKASI